MSAASSTVKRGFLVPEVVQTSSMDCGVAAIKCLLEGFGIRVSYGRLREACQTDVDGTSIDTMEEIVKQLGLEADQEMLPVDHLLVAEAEALPAIVVVRLPNGFTHFVVLWRRHGRFVQMMDPGSGRRWMTCEEFINNSYLHLAPVPASAWRAWAGSEGFLRTLRRRLKDIGMQDSGKAHIDAALSDKSWHTIAALDASARMVASIIRSGGLRHGRNAANVLVALFEQAKEETPGQSDTIPSPYWLVRPASPESDEELLFRGVILVRVRRRRAVAPNQSAAARAGGAAESPALCREVAAAIDERPAQPGREILRRLRADGLLTPSAVVMALTLAAMGGVVEAILFRGLLDLRRELSLVEQRFAAISALVVFMTALLFIELPMAAVIYRLGRRLEARLRMAFLEKIPRLGDRYFQSRPTSDMAERSHSIYRIRLLPGLGGQLIRTVMELLVTAAGIIWLDPGSAPIAITAAALAVALPLLVQGPIAERDLRVRTFTGSLSRFYLDALLGLVAVRTHGAEKAIRREHESMLVEWARSSHALQRAVLSVEAFQSLLGFGLVAWLLLAYLSRAGEANGVLLLLYWSLNLPVLGQEIAQTARQYPSYRNVTQRLLEPLGAPEEVYAQEADSNFALASTDTTRGIAITLQDVVVRAGGHTILKKLDLSVEAGSHIAIVGPSGAGKSSLVGLLLGWHRAAAGQVLIDGAPIDGRLLDQLRRQTAWVDPAVHLWNRSFYENLHYGAPANPALSLGQVIQEADLRLVLENLPDVLQTQLGEGGSLLSGGEGQRVRFGRAMMRSEARLVILDEPFRGLTREKRREFLARTRDLWRDATILCISHDVSETTGFERVLVVEDGRVVEDGAPGALAAQANSRYKALLEAEEAVLQSLWSGDTWRRLRLDRGRLVTSDKELTS
ncbi:MAG: ATP-binding cassette domain-containing protein [Acidobacteriota bacterium]